MTAERRVKVHFLERSAGQAQVKQHPLVLRAILWHLFQNLIVHVVLNAGCSFFFQLVDRADDLGFHWSLCWERLSCHLSLEPDRRFGEHRRVHATCTVPRLRTLVVLHAKNFQAAHIRLNPVLAGVNVGIHQGNQVTSEAGELRGIHHISQILTKLTRGIVVRNNRNFHTTIIQRHHVWVNDVNLQHAVGHFFPANVPGGQRVNALIKCCGCWV